MYEFRATKDWPYHVSSGGVVYKIENGIRKYALLYRKPDPKKDNFESWHLPKGTLSSDETLEECGLREIKEESGLDAVAEKYLGAIERAYVEPEAGWQVDRVVHYFLCKYRSGDSSQMDHEHDALEWCTAKEAIRKLWIHPKKENQIIERAEKHFSPNT
ncbi:NUDIX domain-containing protein [Candidatus Microgenomates bacterium]|nr:NUDIX domain-containing protein [Candidatus Microgenomates bacterium]